MAETWQRVASDFNRFVQKCRRKYKTDVQYIRTYEAQDSDFCHVHGLFKFETPFDGNGRYFKQKSDFVLLKFTGNTEKSKPLWDFGHSDFRPTKGETTKALFYLSKYISKQASLKTIYRKLFPSTDRWDRHYTHITINPPPFVLPPPSASKAQEMCRKYKIRQVYWSRRFF